MRSIRFTRFSVLAAGAGACGVDHPELEEHEVEFPLVDPEAVIAEADRLALVLSNRADEEDGLPRARLLHSLLAQEIDYLHTSGGPIPRWLLTAIDETEWAVQETRTATSAA